MLTIDSNQAELIAKWIAERYGVQVWRSVNLSNPAGQWLSPAIDRDGNPCKKPNWQCANEPAEVVTDIAQVQVVTPVEVKRFHVGVRMGGQGLTLKVTDAGTRRIRAAVSAAGEGAWYEFDYGDEKNAVIYKPGETVALHDYLARQIAG